MSINFCFKYEGDDPEVKAFPPIIGRVVRLTDSDFAVVFAAGDKQLGVLSTYNPWSVSWLTDGEALELIRGCVAKLLTETKSDAS